MLTFFVYLLLGNSFNIALNTFVTILVVACPCSLGLATPLAIVISQGVCASNGILVKKSEILENAQKANTIVFDKTGTLTYGKLRIAKIVNYTDKTEKEVMKLAGSIEAKSTHPIREAFIDYIEKKQLDFYEVREFEEISGYGVTGIINDEKIILGNRKILTKFNIENKYEEKEIELAKDGNSIVYVAKNKKVIAIIGVNDVVRENAKQVIEEFNKNNIETIMLTGDNEETANKIANEIGITKIIAGVVPSKKANIIKELEDKGKFVIMCGDGINDSPALATSNIGVSVHSGTDIAMDSSDVILINNNLQSILKLINISKKTIKNIKQNLFWAFFYNTLMIPIAMGILKPYGISINPMLASIAMMFSSFTVILNALKLKRI